MAKRQKASHRVAVTQTTHQRLRDLSYGLGMTQDQAIQLLLDQVLNPDEDAFLAGRRLQKNLMKPKRQVATNGS